MAAEQSPLDHALGVASNKTIYVMPTGEFVYISSVQRTRHTNHAWGYYDRVVYRGLTITSERTMPKGTFLKTAKLIGKTVEQFYFETRNASL